MRARVTLHSVPRMSLQEDLLRQNVVIMEMLRELIEEKSKAPLWKRVLTRMFVD